MAQAIRVARRPGEGAGAGVTGGRGQLDPATHTAFLDRASSCAETDGRSGSSATSRWSTLESSARVAIIGNQVDTLVRFRGPLIQEMVRGGLQVFALAPGYTAAQKQKVRDLGGEPVEISLRRADMNPWHNLRELIQLWAVLKRLRPDAVLTYFLKPSAYGCLAASLAGVPKRWSLIEGMGYVFEDGVVGWRRRALRRLMTGVCRLSLPLADRVFVLNRDDEALLAQLGIVAAERIVRLPGIGIDLDDYAMVLPVTAPVTFLLMARLIVEKGIRDYAAAARLIKARGGDARFVLLGGLEQCPGALAEAEVRRWVDEGLIEWPGFVGDVRPWLRQASVCVLPSYYREGFPRSILEAMAMGRPIITTDTPGCREAVTEGENGFLIPVRDPAALAEAMTRFIARPDLVVTMGRASRQAAEDNYDLHKVNAILLETMGLRNAEARRAG